MMGIVLVSAPLLTVGIAIVPEANAACEPGPAPATARALVSFFLCFRSFGRPARKRESGQEKGRRGTGRDKGGTERPVARSP
jgi:hypothetical protein